MEQVTWEEDAKEAQSWLTERENDLKSILKSSDTASSGQQNGKNAAVGEDAVRTQLRILQRQDQVQVWTIRPFSETTFVDYNYG